MLEDIETMTYTNRSPFKSNLDVMIAVISSISSMVALLDPELGVVG